MCPGGQQCHLRQAAAQLDTLDQSCRYDILVRSGIGDRPQRLAQTISCRCCRHLLANLLSSVDKQAAVMLPTKWIWRMASDPPTPRRGSDRTGMLYVK